MMLKTVLMALVACGLGVAPALAEVSAGIEASNNCYDQFRTGNMEKAVEFCTTAIISGELDKDELVGALINRGVAFRALGKYKRAISDYSAALNHAPNDAMIYANRANARRDLGELKNAYDDANKAIALDGERAASFYTRGAVLEAAGQLRNARKDYMQALELAPDNMAFQNSILQLDEKLAQNSAGRQP